MKRQIRVKSGNLYYKNRKRLSVGDRRYFLEPCDNRLPATPAWIPLGDTMCGYCTVVSVSSAL